MSASGNHSGSRLLAVLFLGASLGVLADKFGEPHFERCDTNRDGHISVQEFRALKKDGQAFDEADSNKNGRLDRNEYNRAASSREPAWEWPQHTAGGTWSRSLSVRAPEDPDNVQSQGPPFTCGLPDSFLSFPLPPLSPTNDEIPFS
jgi:hypothetical protein